MRLPSASRTEAVAGIAVIALCPVVAALAMSKGKLGLLVVAGLAAMAIGTYVGLRHPLWLYWGLGVALGFLPFGYVPGVHLPLVLLFATGSVLAALVHPSARPGLHSLEVVLLFWVLLSGVSMIASLKSMADVIDYVKWSIATLLVLALLRLSRDNMVRFGQVFVYAVAANALFGVAILATGLPLIKVLRPFGYGFLDPTRFVYSDEGVAQSVRLGGAWVDPNAAGVALVVALCVSVVVLDGWRRLAVSSLLTVGVALTLSRSAIASVMVGVVVVLLFHSMQRRHRLGIVAGLGLAGTVAMIVPAIRDRLLSSFDVGAFAATSRWDPILDFPNTMAGHWLFGLGWGRPEFKDGTLAFTMGHVSNAPLLTVYRGGLMVGLAFVIVLIIGCVISWRAVRSESLPAALYGGLFIGFVVVALQLDHPVVAVPPMTTTFTILLAFLVFVDRERSAQKPVPPDDLATPVPAVPEGNGLARDYPGIPARTSDSTA